MSEQDYPPEFLERVKAVTAKRPKTVIEHILKFGFITTEELKNQYGYNHPPRAAMDVKDQGIPLVSFKVKAADGRSISAYKFGDLSQIRNDRLGGRKLFSKDFKTLLVSRIGSKCGICVGLFEERYLQVDHRIPYQVSGDTGYEDRDPDDYMLLDGSCNRAKSWSCEQCKNFTTIKDPEICKTCYWASPEDYTHIAMRESRRVDVVWNEKETADYDALKKQADAKRQMMPEYVKEILRKFKDQK